MSHNLTDNATGRMLPTEINRRPVTPFMGVGKYRPQGHKAAAPAWSPVDLPDVGN